MGQGWGGGGHVQDHGSMTFQLFLSSKAREPSGSPADLEVGHGWMWMHTVGVRAEGGASGQTRGHGQPKC